MWVFCGGMQRSGSTLQFQLTAHLIEMAGRGERQEWVTPETLPERLHEFDEAKLKVIKTHAFTEAVEAEFKHGRAMGVYVFRDIRDVVVSIIHKEDKAFHEDWVKRRIDNNLKWFHQWTGQPRTLVSKYEDMIHDLPSEVKRLADHFSISVTSQQAEDIAAGYTLDKQREKIEEATKQNRLENAGRNAVFDPHSLLHTNHIRSGEVGGWQDELTPEQTAVIEAHAREWLTANGYALTQVK